LISIIGWDIGGANVKAAWLAVERGRLVEAQIASRPFQIWREKDRLLEVVREVRASAAHDQPVQAMALTMTAELADIFATKREGVLFIFKGMQAAFPGCPIYALSLAGKFTPLIEAQETPLEFAAANWMASALWYARQFPNCLLIDVGSTTTDILPILNGQVMVAGRTDLERLSSGELVYTGALRTNLAAIVQSAPVAGRFCRTASEYFAVSGDVHLILGHLTSEDYTCPTPDGQPPTIDTARQRLARLVCADTEMLSTPQIDELAHYIYAQQLNQISQGIQQVLSRLPGLRSSPVIVLGSGAFLAAQAATQMGLKVHNHDANWSLTESAVTPCLAAARLLAENLSENSDGV
jgi:probable H4MPT-linked C1 transfer pathway protein